MKVRKAAKRRQKKRIFKQPQAINSEDVAVRYAEKIAKAAAYVQERLRQTSTANVGKKLLVNEPENGILAGFRPK
ncbi:hypothetical protein UNDKW_0073 [Undibacterium sp. KW1]|uniref:hypothetical protein n=1 Tax=Undibacterium sp. KW1 TaxID=2058624 RepID=UPI001331C7B6|nr:hypothetical protein [Undibacterium sp. KW1]BBB58346.1 hypothetical protein UNDKW_0073 [Undibacterium sp. KW1]